MNKTCVYCGKVFKRGRNSNKRKFCSRTCNLKHDTCISDFKLSLIQSKELRKKCYICKFDISIHIHHILPRKKGGKDVIENYLPLCSNHHRMIHAGFSIEQMREHHKKLYGESYD